MSLEESDDAVPSGRLSSLAPVPAPSGEENEPLKKFNSEQLSGTATAPAYGGSYRGRRSEAHALALGRGTRARIHYALDNLNVQLS
jgi:hypothetical protein